MRPPWTRFWLIFDWFFFLGLCIVSLPLLIVIARALVRAMEE